MADQWEALWDESSQLYYYYNSVTEETTWDKPDGFVEPQADGGVAAGDAATSPTHDEPTGPQEWRLHPEQDTGCTLASFIKDYGEAEGNSYWEDAMPMRPSEDGTLLTQDEFFEDLGDEAGQVSC